MMAVAQNCHDVRESYHSSLVGLELDDTQMQMLLSITRRHCKLGVEHGRADTSPERRRQVRDEISSLRALRNDLITEWRKDVRT
ncbi:MULTISPECIES: hypothetical protein [unclassified Paenibacillus]|uniref:hypothetical protein n=1 Tax=unclassified Paenibacillus TaxID=185978 RepID=UPI0006CF9C57|nr:MULTISPECIES: hypothetical protein [unclassified Paenibacillus]